MWSESAAAQAGTCACQALCILKFLMLATVQVTSQRCCGHEHLLLGRVWLGSQAWSLAGGESFECLRHGHGYLADCWNVQLFQRYE